MGPPRRYLLWTAGSRPIRPLLSAGAGSRHRIRTVRQAVRYLSSDAARLRWTVRPLSQWSVAPSLRNAGRDRGRAAAHDPITLFPRFAIPIPILEYSHYPRRYFRGATSVPSASCLYAKQPAIRGRVSATPAPSHTAER